jgi:hypothetical protein
MASGWPGKGHETLLGSTPSSTPSSPAVQVDVYPPVFVFVVLERAAGDAFTDGSLRNTKPTGRFLDGKAIYPASIPFVHMGILDH